MVDSQRSLRFTRLVEWSFAAFHTTYFVLIAFTLLYTQADLGELLASLNTLIGVGVFALLWLTTWWCTRRAVAELVQVKQMRVPSLGTFLWLGVKWGAVNGILFFLPIIVLTILFLFANLAARSLDASQVGSALGSTTGGLFFAIVFGMPAALVIGGLVGLGFGLIDAGIARLAFLIFDSWVTPHAEGGKG